MGVHFLTRYRNPLAYPAGYKPGFDPSHVGARGIVRFTGVAVPLSFLEITSGRSADSIAVAPSFNMTSQGPGLYVNDISCDVKFTGKPAIAETSATIASILRYRNLTANGGFCGSFHNHGTTGTTIGISQFSNAAKPMIRIGSVNNTDTGFTFVVNTPYFFVCTTDSANARFAIVNLQTGVSYFSEISVTGTAGTVDGKYTIGDWANITGNPLIGDLYACAYTNSYLSLAELKSWAADPWSFWYPNPGDNWIAAQASGFPYWGVQNNNFVIGSGVQ